MCNYHACMQSIWNENNGKRLFQLFFYPIEIDYFWPEWIVKGRLSFWLKWCLHFSFVKSMAIGSYTEKPLMRKWATFNLLFFLSFPALTHRLNCARYTLFNEEILSVVIKCHINFKQIDSVHFKWPESYWLHCLKC